MTTFQIELPDATAQAARAAGLLTPEALDRLLNEAANARFANRELLKQFQDVEPLSDEDKNVVKKPLDAFLTRKQLQAMVR
jgi:hypothetical protein